MHHVLHRKKCIPYHFSFIILIKHCSREACKLGEKERKDMDKRVISDFISLLIYCLLFIIYNNNEDLTFTVPPNPDPNLQTIPSPQAGPHNIRMRRNWPGNDIDMETEARWSLLTTASQLMRLTTSTSTSTCVLSRLRLRLHSSSSSSASAGKGSINNDYEQKKTKPKLVLSSDVVHSTVSRCPSDLIALSFFVWTLAHRCSYSHHIHIEP